ncbi:uncharacterized protein CCOS01_05301 [Colletotrichum costaricense]|uniref:Uncharacterized protein n=1 Tax=Colletotrichum costaricense TaxID=1209916 RepID=A0AAI9Z080_9PEZI|nr:uncharacterized protein CCOS01_05301 [Colletotrichum costaricense]KAK1530198.1 hypothetical protein CCOS01_05301 [Colletotrichum costaricense]
MDRTDHPHSNSRLRVDYGSKAGLAAFYTSRNDLIFADICSVNSAMGKRVWDTNTAISLLDAWMLHPNTRGTKFGLWNAVAAQRRLKKKPQDFGPLKIPKYRTSSNTTALEGSTVSNSSTVFCAVILDGVDTTNICSDSAVFQIFLSLGPPGALPSSYAMPRLKCLAAAAANNASLRVADISNPISLRHLDPSSSLQRRLRLHPHLAVLPLSCTWDLHWLAAAWNLIFYMHLVAVESIKPKTRLNAPLFSAFPSLIMQHDQSGSAASCSQWPTHPSCPCPGALSWTR